MLPLSSSSTLESVYPPVNSSSPSIPHPRTPYQHAFPQPYPLNYTRESYASATNLVPRSHPSPKAKVFSLNWDWLPMGDKKPRDGLISPPERKGRTKDGGDKNSQPFYHGWRHAFLGSYLNVLLLLVPASFFLNRSAIETDTIVFIFCVLSLIPLVRLHDLATSSLASRIGGTKAALLNASMGNTVELVITFIALRKCELKIVQSSLIGSMLSKSLLVFGMCTFAGGLRWKEQWFDSEATQVQSSLLSISTSAVLLPAAFHFALRIDDDDDSINRTPAANPSAKLDYGNQKLDILRMSHGVAVVMLLIYAAYLVFQLYSHTHLYKDSAAGARSRRFSAKSSKKILEKIDCVPSKKNNERESTHARSSSLTLRGSSSQWVSTTSDSNSGSSKGVLRADTSLMDVDDRDTVKLVQKDLVWDNVAYLSRTSTRDTDTSEDTLLEVHFDDNKQIDSEEDASEKEKAKEPMLSWLMTVLLLLVVTVLVAATADWLVESMDTISDAKKYVSKEWIGLILLPTVRVIAECVTAINTSVKDQLTLSSGVAIGSTIQTALFVIPFTVIIAWIMNLPLGMLFDPFESVVLYISIHTMNYVVADGKSNWMEGLILVCLYFIIAISFWFYPGSNLPSSLATCPVVQ